MRHADRKYIRPRIRPLVTSDPLATVFSLGTKRHAAAFSAFAALLLHGTAAAQAVSVSLDMFRWADSLRGTIKESLDQEYTIEEAKPPPPPEEEPPKDEPKPEKTPNVKKEEAPPAAPAAAQAAKIIAQEPDPTEPVDLTNAMISGNAVSYAGGETRSDGTNKNAVRNVATSPKGVPGGTGTGTASEVDLSRAAERSGSSDWKCPWPQEADSEQIDDAYVSIQVTIGPDGKATKVSIIEGGEHGFGHEARGCALRESYRAGLDRAGKPTTATKSLRMHFER